MTREEAIGNLKHAIKWNDTPKKEALDMAIKALEQRWIPVSERLPKVGSEVLVCFDFKGNRSVYIANFYSDGKFYGLDDEYLSSEGRKYRKAVAWMPLPEPYKAESNLDGDPVDIDKAVEHYEKTLETLKGIDLEVEQIGDCTGCPYAPTYEEYCNGFDYCPEAYTDKARFCKRNQDGGRA